MTVMELNVFFVSQYAFYHFSNDLLVVDEQYNDFIISGTVLLSAAQTFFCPLTNIRQGAG